MKDDADALYQAIATIKGELVFGMTVTIDEGSVVIQIGKERFLLDDSTAGQVHGFFSSAAWLAAMRIED